MSKQYEQLINALKVRAFDAQDKADFLESQLKDRERVLMDLVRILGIEPDENGTVSLDAITEKVESLLKEQGDAAEELLVEAEEK